METMWHSHPWHFAPTWNLSTAHRKKWNQDPEDLAGNHWDSTQQLYEMWSNSNWRTFTYPAYFGKLLLLALEESPGWATTGMILKLSWMSWIGGSLIFCPCHYCEDWLFGSKQNKSTTNRNKQVKAMPLMPALQSSQKPLAELNPYPKQRRHRATDLGSFWKVWDNVWNKLKPLYFEGTQFWPIYFFLWSQRSWAAHFLSPEDAPQRQLWPGIRGWDKMRKDEIDGQNRTG